jgi:hypothetical protein
MYVHCSNVVLYTNSGQVDELWDSMCHTAISLISKALNDVDNAEVLLKIKGVLALFIQTMDVSTEKKSIYAVAHSALPRAGDIL